jgi:cell division protease FtsH
MFHSRPQLVDRIAMALGGRVAEEVRFGEVTTGASNDLEHVTQLARSMVTSYGMSDLIGPLALGQKQGEVFLGRDYGHETNYSPEVAAIVDDEVRKLVRGAHARAEAILTAYRSTLEALAEEMLERETLEDKDLERIFGDLDTWVDPDPSAITDGALPPRPLTESGAAHETVMASEAEETVDGARRGGAAGRSARRPSDSLLRFRSGRPRVVAGSTLRAASASSRR